MSYDALDIFEQLRPEDTQWLLASSELKTISAGRVLVREDDPSETIFFVADGLFEVYVYAGPTHNLKVGQLGPGDVIGEISWLDRRPISASVRAVETSCAIALSTAALERKLAEDPRFAARFFRGVATLTAERLRKTTSDLRRSQWAAGSHPATVTAANDDGILHEVKTLKTLVEAAEKRAAASNGAIPEPEAQQIRGAFAALEQAVRPQGDKSAAGVAEVLHAELQPLVKLSATGERCTAKPRGYAGDYQTIEMIYANAPAGTGAVGALLDGCVLNLTAAKAIRNRRRLIAGEILSSYRAAAKELHVASLACGPAREIFDVLDKVDDRGRLQVSCVDIDREALAQLGAQCQERNLSQQVRTFQGNLIHLATGRQELELTPQDLIYSINFADYLSDEMVLTLLNWTHDKLRPGGRVVLGNFHPRNPTRGLMDHVLEWRLTHRDEAEMNQLFVNSRFARPCSRILFEDEGAYLLAECHK
jgi:extracellular factor (EF) 3-hydroxypalmitic acid methyl ester biosynthesis protein